MMNGNQHIQLKELIKSAFNPAALQQLTRFTTNQTLNDLVPPGETHQHCVFLLLAELEDQGLLTRFLKGAMKARPDNEDIQMGVPEQWPEVLKTLPAGTVNKAGASLPTAIGAQRGIALERVVRDENPFFNLALLRSRLGELEGRVCRVDINGAPQGTGFLIGRQLVLTNYHVVEKILNGQFHPGSLSCLFDHKILPGGQLSPGDRIPLLPGGEILVSSPYTIGEGKGTPEVGLPLEDQLDFAVLQLNRPAADDEINGPGFVSRGFETLPVAATNVLPGVGLIIAQHPMGEPMKLAIDTQSVIGYNGNKTRLRYRTNTEGGSSGSPVYDMDWKLVALHHLGDPARGPANFNQGVAALHLIRGKIAAQYAHLLG